MGDDGGRGITSVPVHHDQDSIGRQHLEDTGKGRLREGVGVHPQIEGAGDVLSLAIFVDRLGDGDNVHFVKAALEGCAAMAGGAKGHALLAQVRVRLLGVVGRDQTRNNIDQHRRRRRLTGKRMVGHGRILRFS